MGWWSMSDADDLLGCSETTREWTEREEYLGSCSSLGNNPRSEVRGQRTTETGIQIITWDTRDMFK